MDNKEHQVEIAYGKGYTPFNMDPNLARWEVIRPAYEKPVSNPRETFIEKCRKPVGCPPLRDIIKADDKVVIVTCDGTRAVPNQVLIPWILEEMLVPDENVTILLGTGTHRPNSDEEIESMFGPEIPKRVNIVNHNCFEPAENFNIGKTSTGGQTSVNKLYVEADKTIVVGFIEPHFFAGFSGGAKGIVPAIASLDTIFHIHSASLIDDPQSTWGILDENPLRQEIEEMVRFSPPDFMVNVALNINKEISAFFIGHYVDAHRPGCLHVKEGSMQAFKKTFPLVITSNSGYPLDQNLYQTVKGLSAAARIVDKGGDIFFVSECSDGPPFHGNFAELMQIGKTPQDILDHIFSLKQPVLDQWQAQTLANILNKANVHAFSSMSPELLQKCKLIPVENLQTAVEEKLRTLDDYRVAIMPDGPLNIPYID